MPDHARWPIFFEGGAMVLATKEKEFLEYFLGCGDAEIASEKAGMTFAAAKEFMRSERIKKYVSARVEAAGRRNAITLDSVLDRLHKIAWGEIKVTRYEMKSLEILASYLSILKPSVQVAVLNKIESPLAALQDDELDKMIAARNDVPRIAQ